MKYLMYFLWVVSSLVLAQPYPSKAVRVVVPFAPGAATDSLARLMAAELQQALGSVFLVENRAGANGVIAAEFVARSAPDGYTLFVATNTTQAANPSLYRKLPYDPLKDFTAVSRLTSSQFILVVHPGVAAQSVKEFVALLRAQPGKLSYATSNSASLVAMEWLRAAAKLDIVGIAYKSNGTALTDLMGGRIHAMFADQANAVPAIKAGKLRALAVSGQQRTKLLPELPTLQEAGIEGVALNTWAGLFAPARLPPAIVERLNAAIAAALRKPEVIERLSGLGYEAVGSTPAELAAFNKAEVEVWRRAITAARIEPE
jgi:tripartite-type tricarboxylate transporter receptor subunit TctC